MISLLFLNIFAAEAEDLRTIIEDVIYFTARGSGKELDEKERSTILNNMSGKTSLPNETTTDFLLSASHFLTLKHFHLEKYTALLKKQIAWSLKGHFQDQEKAKDILDLINSKTDEDLITTYREGVQFRHPTTNIPQPSDLFVPVIAAEQKAGNT